MSTARKQSNQDHQVRQRKQPLIRLDSRAFRRPGNKSQVPALREIMQVIHANAGQAGNFRVGEDLLARFDGNHGSGPLSVRLWVRP